MSTARFWETKTLAQMSREEWESLCDGCGKCCLHKLEDTTDGRIYYTDVACRYLDLRRCRCTAYDTRDEVVADCVRLEYESPDQMGWLPPSCAYRALAEGRGLPEWHPLVTGDPDSTRSSGNSVVGRVVSELAIDENDLESRIVKWVGNR